MQSIVNGFFGGAVSRTLIVINPRAGGGMGAKVFPQVQAALHEAGVEFDVEYTRAALDAFEIGRAAPSRGYERIITAGGDGINHEVLNGLLRASNERETITLGIIPLGTGNDFVKSLPPALEPGGQRNGWHAAVQRIAAGKTTLVDVGRITGDVPVAGQPHPHYFANGIDVGFGAMVARAVQSVPRWLPPTGYYMAGVLKVLANYKLPRVTIHIDDAPPRTLNTTMVVVANGRCLGSSFWLTPTADVTDGLFDVLIADRLGRVPIVALIPRLMKGTHLGHPALTYARARRVIIESQEPLILEADGELPFLQAHRFEVEVLPRKLRVIV